VQALLSLHAGGPETLRLRDIDEPAPGPGQVSISVRACGVNFPDVLVIEDRYQLRPARPFSPGSELAGIVRRVGAGVDSPGVGQRVSASLPFGAMAEVVVVSADRCVVIPDAMPFHEAAALQVTYGTVYYALAGRGRLRTGQTLLVLGAGGGIGLAAVELGKALGARVIAAASTQDKLDAAQRSGSDVGVLYSATLSQDADARALTESLLRACGGEGADVVIDPVGGSYAEPAFRSIAWQGRYLVVGFAAGIPSLPLDITLTKEAEVIGVFWGAYMARDPAAGAADMKVLLDLYAGGRIRPVVSERYPLERGGEAIARLASRTVRGKVVIDVCDSESRMKN
jgi:NADPH2:quinone reductase